MGTRDGEMSQALVQVGRAIPDMSLSFAIRIALLSPVLLLPIRLVNIAVMDLDGPFSRPFVSRKFFSERNTAVPSAFAKTAHHELNRVPLRVFGDIILHFGDLRSGSVCFGT